MVRVFGWDARSGRGVPAFVPHEHRAGKYKCTLHPSKWLHAWLYHEFLPQAVQEFDNEPELQYIVYVEDDARPVSGTTFQTIVDSALAGGTSAVWMGFRMHNGEPRYGSQLVCFSRYSASWLLKYMAAQIDEEQPWKYFEGLDTWIYKLHRGQVRMQNGSLAFVVPPASLASQRSHALSGRK